jgi:hypothetical protein
VEILGKLVLLYPFFHLGIFLQKGGGTTLVQSAGKTLESLNLWLSFGQEIWDVLNTY